MAPSDAFPAKGEGGCPGDPFLHEGSEFSQFLEVRLSQLRRDIERHVALQLPRLAAPDCQGTVVGGGGDGDKSDGCEVSGVEGGRSWASGSEAEASPIKGEPAALAPPRRAPTLHHSPLHCALPLSATPQRRDGVNSEHTEGSLCSYSSPSSRYMQSETISAVLGQAARMASASDQRGGGGGGSWGVRSSMTATLSKAIKRSNNNQDPTASASVGSSRRPSVASLYVGGIPNGEQGALSGILYTANFGRMSRERSDAQELLGQLGDTWDEWLMAIITITNTITIGMSTDLHPDWPGWIFIDGLFALAFLSHMLMILRRLGFRMYFKGKRNDLKYFFYDTELRWRYFEFALVVLAVLEVGLATVKSSVTSQNFPKISILRLLRLTRIARILRVCRLKILSELTMMINGAIGGMRTLLWSGLIVALPLYAVALLLRESLSSESPKGGGIEYFSTLPDALFTLFRCIIGGDCADSQGRPIFLRIAQTYGTGYALTYVLTVLFMVFGLFNVIAAIFVENTLAAAKYNHVVQKRQRIMDTQMFAERAVELVALIAKKYARDRNLGISAGSGGSGEGYVLGENFNIQQAMQIQISPEFFNDLRTDPKFKRLLLALDISDEDQLDLFETLDVDGSGTIDLEELIIGLRKLRGDARKSDVVGVALIVRSMQLQMTRFVEDMTTQMDYHGKALRMLQINSGGISSDTMPARDVHRPCTSAVVWRSDSSRASVASGPVRPEGPLESLSKPSLVLEEEDGDDRESLTDAI